MIDSRRYIDNYFTPNIEDYNKFKEHRVKENIN